MPSIPNTNSVWFVFAAYCVLSHSTVSVDGQYAVSSCAFSLSESEEGPSEHDQKLQVMNEALSSAIDKINEKLDTLVGRVNENLQRLWSEVYCRGRGDICDCSDIKVNGFGANGVYRIYVDHQGERHYANAYCDMTTANRGWTVFQKRRNGSEDFYRGWNDYKNGFGNPEGEYWLGNEFIYLLTSKRRYRLRIDLEDFEGEKRFALYSSFSVSSSAANYSLAVGRFTSGSLRDSFTYHNGQQFSTKDAENDKNSDGNCAEWGQAGWWYGNCIGSNLNGLYLHGNYSASCPGCHWSGITWELWHGLRYSLKTTEMKISAAF